MKSINQILSFFKNHSALLKCAVVLFNILCFCVAAWVLPIKFEQNDDVVMCMIANGHISGMPDGHLVFINAIYGTVVAWLYTLTNAIEWYTVMFSLMHIVSISVIVWYLIKKEQPLVYKLLLLLITYVIWFRLIVCFQFTTTAALAAIAGCLLLAEHSTKRYIYGGVLLLIASMVRIESCALVIILFAPIVVYMNRLCFKKYIPYAIIMAVILGGVLIDKLFYTAPEWQYYMEYNDIRGRINDNPNFDKMDYQALEAKGISHLDYIMLGNFMQDPATMDLNKLKEIEEIVKDVPASNKSGNIQNLVPYRIPLVLILFFIMVVCVMVTNRQDRLWVVALGLLFYIVVIGTSLSHYVKDRVFLSSLLSIVLFISVVPISFNVSKSKIGCLCLLMLGIAGKYGLQTCKYSRSVKKMITNEWEMQQMPLIASLPSDAELCARGVWLDLVNPFELKSFPCKLSFSMGWMTYNPLCKQTSHKWFMNDNVYLMVDDPKAWGVYDLIDHIRNEYGIALSVHNYNKTNTFSIIQLKQQ